jgi:hypothetical protein
MLSEIVSGGRCYNRQSAGNGLKRGNAKSFASRRKYE